MRNWDYRFIRLAFSGVRRTDSNVATLSTQGNGKFIAPIAPPPIKFLAWTKRYSLNRMI